MFRRWPSVVIIGPGDHHTSAAVGCSSSTSSPSVLEIIVVSCMFYWSCKSEADELRELDLEVQA
ncbi:hypothetical protein E2562_022578 [Oryza meyeriana var. granulata]|uniref:Uncharacterized protein n=1 Tax=Oryza meyeriana var. granulata TaxID=110450 RepID=A0A6G1CHR3_9ORYZ|nr:hypothetical protein E2562_022578 [Oryza meyeriana var. granulata]